MPQLPAPIQQWTLDVTITHHASFGHRVQAAVLGRHGGWHSAGTWNWTGLGVPESLVNDLNARVTGIITEHLVTRYGIQGELPTRWAGEPDPF